MSLHALFIAGAGISFESFACMYLLRSELAIVVFPHFNAIHVPSRAQYGLGYHLMACVSKVGRG